jgi:hypothetical protein
MILVTEPLDSLEDILGNHLSTFPVLKFKLWSPGWSHWMLQKKMHERDRNFEFQGLSHHKLSFNHGLFNCHGCSRHGSNHGEAEHTEPKLLQRSSSSLAGMVTE